MNKRKPNGQYNDLPHRWTWKNGAYYYLDKGRDPERWDGQKWFRLGKTFDEAMKTYNERVFGQYPPPPLLKRYPEVARIDSKQSVLDMSFKDSARFVYFLIDGDEIVYVGQSGNPTDRIAVHRANPDFVFDRVSMLPVDSEYIFPVENHYIQLFRPRYNVWMNENGRQLAGKW